MNKSQVNANINARSKVFNNQWDLINPNLTWGVHSHQCKCALIDAGAVHCSLAMWECLSLPDLWPFVTLAWQRWRTQVEWQAESVSVWKVVEVDFHAGSGLCGCGAGVVECHQHHCASFGADQVFVDFRWSVEISWRMVLLEEQDGAVVGVFWPFSSPVHWIY